MYTQLVAIVLLATWLALSACAQLPRKYSKWVIELNWLALIPDWHFFAPQPATSDFHLLYRDVLVEGSVTYWREVPFNQPRDCWSCSWNPDRRRNKALFDYATTLAQELIRAPAAIQTCIPYLALLTFVVGLPHDRTSQSTQFLILKSHGTLVNTLPDVLFVSSLHSL